MSLAESLQHEKAQGVRKGPDCSLCVALRAMKPEDTRALTDALADLTMTGAAISRALKAEGYNISPTVVNRHRKDECRR